ncbi:MAG TPA: hypothetical protein V6C57_24660 [Coleofasciculaceae cyanobacterium]
MMLTQYTFINAQNLLIKPVDRVRFVLSFIFATAGGLLIAKYITHQLDLQFFGAQCTIPCAIVEGCITGMIAGSFQWLVLRKYVPNRMWILVFTLFLILASCSNVASTMTVQAIIDGQAHFVQLPVLLILFIIINMTVSIIFGYLQWLVLRPYVSKARWWIITPLVVGVGGAFTAYIFYAAPSLIQNYRSLLAFNAEVFRLTGLASVQAIAFCLLRRKLRENPWLSSPLALAPDISSYWENNRLARKLHAQIIRTWKSNLEGSEQLVYFVGVDQTGSVASYESMSSVATERAKQTPLPDLLISSETESATPLAKYKATFIPPGSVKISSYRGIPLLWLATAICTGVLGISKVLGLIEVATGRVISF